MTSDPLMMAGHEIVGGAQVVWPMKLSPSLGMIGVLQSIYAGCSKNVVPAGFASTTLWIAVPGLMLTTDPA